jgi:ankyrin repeat protein
MGALEEAVLRSDHTAMKAAIDAGENINDMSSGMTPLLSAVFRGDLEAVRILLDAGADPNLHSDLDGSPLWHAEDDFGLFAIAKLLKAHGALK